MPSDARSLALIAENWLEVSEEVFWTLKRVFPDLGDKWYFSIKSPDAEIGEGRTEDLRANLGKAAFMLRRIQAQRLLVREGTWDIEATQLSLGYLSDLNAYIEALSSSDLGETANEEDVLSRFTYTNKVLLAATMRHFRAFRGLGNA